LGENAVQDGVNPRIAGNRVGHSKVGITLVLYSHVLPGKQKDADARVDDAMRVAIQRRAMKPNWAAER
jgi:hypothetical protein